jgi:hypothetical protein
VALKGHEIKLPAEAVERLRQLSRRLSFTRDEDISWPQLVRLGVEWVLEADGERLDKNQEKEVAQ